MKALAAIALCSLSFVTSAAFAAANVQSRTISQTGHSVESHSKASSFVPRPRSKRHVYGAPIQRPILKNRPAHRVPSAPSVPSTSSASSVPSVPKSSAH
jgi:hypothetical protein